MSSSRSEPDSFSKAYSNRTKVGVSHSHYRIDYENHKVNVKSYKTFWTHRINKESDRVHPTFLKSIPAKNMVEFKTVVIGNYVTE